MEALSKSTSNSLLSLEKLASLMLGGNDEIYLSGLKGSFFAYGLSRLAREIARSFLVITSDNDEAAEVCGEIQFYLGKEKVARNLALFFPSWETLPYDTIDPQLEHVISRIETLHHLQEKEETTIVVAPLRALMQHCISPGDLARALIVVRAGEALDRDHFVERLLVSGYREVALVEEKGEFSVRGGIVDVFPPLYPDPIRMELFGDMVESVRQFNPVTQRSIANRDSFCLLPVSEVILDARARQQALASLATVQKKERIPSALGKTFSEQLERLRPFPERAFLLEFFYRELGTLVHFLPKDSFVWVYGIADLKEKAADFFATAAQNLALCRSEGKLSSLGTNLYLTPEKMLDMLAPFPRIVIDPLEILRPGKTTCRFSSVDTKDVYEQIVVNRTRSRPLAKLAQRLREWIDENFVVVMVFHSDVQRKRAQELLEDYDLPLRVPDQFSFFQSDQREEKTVLLILGQLNRGFRSWEDRIVVLTEIEIFGDKIPQVKKFEAKESDPIFTLADLEEENLVVHVDYGIGRYKGLHSLDVRGNRNDYLLIEYRDGDKLYVPVYRLNLVQKYRGVEGQCPVLNKLGGKTWLQTKQKVKKSIQAHAKQLLKVYAARQALQGFSFSPRDQYYREFEARFEYEETQDQAGAIEDVLADMESSRPMDRLICGDVGFGKTEIALRASFKAVMDGKQLAVLVPTTILAFQHYQTFAHRFRDFPVSIAMMSRFQTPREQKEIVRQLSEGKVDIVIGTHRLLQKDIGFKDLGLVVIDEEHRFGVGHKEQLKKMRSLVDVLTLTATPIPRTLQLSLLKIRDLSIINSPPEDRLAVRTHVTNFDGKTIREAIIREFMRDGQAFFVHNRVENIERIARYLKELVPEANLAVAHGQMPEKELEKVMWDFHDKRVNLLVCTSIIESGLDFPRANTIIVNQAERLGLAQLYQLRGRVGRSNHQAYAYFLVPKVGELTGTARERLKVISEFSALSSGFRLANLDLELRGGGNILGLTQSGHMAQVGIELYYQLIEKAVRQLKGEKSPPEVDPEIRLEIPAYIPEDYIPDIHQRLKVYKRLSGGIKNNEVPDVEQELQDRFGILPPVVENLLLVASLKPILRESLVSSLGYNGKEIVLAFHPEAETCLEKILALVQVRGDQVRFTPDFHLHVSFPDRKDWKALIGEVKKILQ